MSRILVIDDEEEIRNGLNEILGQAGYTVALAENGKAGVNAFRAQPYDLAIVDLLMPEQEGLETIMQLRRLAPHLKIVAISGGGAFGLTEYLEVALKLGAQRTLEKPFRRHEILQVVGELLPPQ